MVLILTDTKPVVYSPTCLSALTQSGRLPAMRKVFITGGAGFIGSNAAEFFSKKGDDVTIFDNFSRAGTRDNASWLVVNYPNIKVVEGDVRNAEHVSDAMHGADIVLHFAAQVAVTTSVDDPREDFEVNSIGSFNVLEAARKMEKMPVVLYSSTNKVYGGMEDLKIIEKNGRYAYENLFTGVSEERGLDFHSPYGCSKGSADQYFHDYFRIYGLKTVVFRQSCIYGYRQFGVEDQGWVAWFAIAAMFDKKITIYGDGKQVRDVLFIDDLLNAYDLAIQNIEKTKGQVYNIGGGPGFTLSLLELVKMLENNFNKKIPLSFTDWRPGDQFVYISNIDKAEIDFKWKPAVGPEEGLKKLSLWIWENKELFADFSSRLTEQGGLLQKSSYSLTNNEKINYNKSDISA